MFQYCIQLYSNTTCLTHLVHHYMLYSHLMSLLLQLMHVHPSTLVRVVDWGVWQVVLDESKSECPAELMQTFNECKGHRSQLLTMIAAMTLVKAMSTKRFRKAVSNKETIPAEILEKISDTMASCKEMSLEIPVQLQVLALKYGPSQKTNPK